MTGASSLAKTLNEEIVQSMTKLLELIKMADGSGDVDQPNNNLPDQVLIKESPPKLFV